MKGTEQYEKKKGKQRGDTRIPAIVMTTVEKEGNKKRSFPNRKWSRSEVTTSIWLVGVGKRGEKVHIFRLESLR